MNAHRMEDLLEAIPDALAMVDREWRFQSLNRRAAALLRGEVRDLIGRVAIEEVSWLLRQPLFGVAERAMKERRSARVEIRLPTGISMEVWFAPVEEGLMVLARDVSSHRRTVDELETILGKLIVSNQELERFTHKVAHDLANPLNAIVTYAAVLGGLDDGNDSSTAARIADVATRMGVALKSQRHAGTAVFRGSGESVSASDFWKDARREVDGRLEAVGIALEDDVWFPEDDSGREASGSSLPLDPGLARQLMRSLLSLVAKSAPGASGRVRLEARREKEEWTLALRWMPEVRGWNPGEGVPIDLDADPGAAIPKWIVGLYAGRIWAQPQDGRPPTLCFSVLELTIPSRLPASAQEQAPL